MIDLCIVNYNTADCLKRLLTTLHTDREENAWNLYVADNDSVDGSRSMLESSDFDIEQVDLNPNIGYARACNSLALYGNAPFIGFLNADVWLTTADVKRVEQSFNYHPEAAIIGPKQRDERGMIRHAGIFLINQNFSHRGWAQPDDNDRCYRDFIECGTVSGSAYFIRRSVWEELTNCPNYRGVAPSAQGAFLDTELYFEETFCSRHAAAHGYKVFYDGTVSIGHTWNASPSTPQRQQKNVAESREYYKKACLAHDITIERNLW